MKKFTMTYDYENGYASHRKNTNKGTGKRVVWRFDIIKRDGNMTPIYENLTRKEMLEVEKEIIEQRGKEASWG